MVGDGIVVGVTVWEGGFHKSFQWIISTDHFILFYGTQSGKKR
jgi:hypothetical protein